MGYGITWKEACIMVYGGLRGAVGLVMGLIVEHNHYVHPDTAQMVAFHTSGIVLLTLLINGSTIDGLYKRLQLYPCNQYRTIHLRKSLFKVEAECQKAGIRAICQDWFFKDCEFKLILRCVPNFCHIQFDTVGVPHPENIDDVRSTLKALAEEAPRTTFDPLLQRRVDSADRNYKDSWRTRKVECERVLVDLMNKPMEAAERKDSLFNVKNTGDKVVEYNPPESKALTGFYISSRPIEALMCGDIDDVIEFKISKIEQVVVVVGLLACDDEMVSFGSQSTDGPLLGVNYQNSIGFRSDTCVAQWNGPLGIGEMEADRPGLEAGEVICVHVGPKKTWAAGAEAGCHDVTFSVKESAGAPATTVLTCCFGPFSAGELFPVIEFRHLDERRMLESQRSGQRMTFTSEADLSNSGVAAIDATVNAVKEVGEDVIEVGKTALAIAKRGIETITRAGQDATSGSGPEHDKSFMSNSATTVGAKVTLSFEPQLASDAESINELFHVLFNTVMHMYTDMHEHGILGDMALSWLSEAVSAGMDCANYEVNARRATHFQMIGANGHLPETPGSGSKSDEPVLSQRSGASLAAPYVHKMRGVFSEMRSASAAKANTVGLFEPLVVEYLTIENIMAKPSMWDQFPVAWWRFRLLGYGSTRAKAESLWAFVEAHKKVLKESACMYRFPDLVRCINTLVDQAKHDLAILEEIQPVRLYYSKHTLALRVLLNRRLAKLRKFTSEGWITPGDAKGFEDAFWERILQADSFNPLTATDWIHGPATPSSAGGHKLLNGANGATNAWADLDLPAIVPFSPQNSVPMTPVRRKSCSTHVLAVGKVPTLVLPEHQGLRSREGAPAAATKRLVGLPGAIETDASSTSLSLEEMDTPKCLAAAIVTEDDPTPTRDKQADSSALFNVLPKSA